MQPEIIIDHAVEHIDLLQRREVIIQLQPYVALDAVYLGIHLCGGQIGVLVLGGQNGALHQLLRPVLPPDAQSSCRSMVMHTVNEQLYPLLDGFVVSGFPEMLQVGNDIFPEKEDLAGDGIKYFLVRIVQQMEQCVYFPRFVQWIRLGLLTINLRL